MDGLAFAFDSNTCAAAAATRQLPRVAAKCGRRPARRPIECSHAPLDAAPLDAGPPVTCDPLAPTACQAGQKCAQVVITDNPLVAENLCVPAGPVPLGGACTTGPAGPTTGFDDCAAGLQCRAGTCAEICSISPDSCPAGSECTRYNGLFDSDPNVGVCDPTCDPLDQATCPGPDACYLNVFSESSSCANVAGSLEQNEVCPFLNVCSEGLGCILAFPNDSNLYCATYCDASLGSPGICAGIPEIANGTPTCARVNDYWSGVNVNPDLGMCIDCSDARINGFDVCTNP